MPPDVRYDGWNKKAQYDKQVISRNVGNKFNVQPQLPSISHNLLKEDENSQLYHEEALREAQKKAANAKNNELEFSKQLQETRNALEKEIHRQLVEQLTLRAQKKSVTPDQQALIEKLYLDLRLINPELALATLKASAALDGSAQAPIQFSGSQVSHQQDQQEKQYNQHQEKQYQQQQHHHQHERLYQQQQQHHQDEKQYHQPQQQEKQYHHHQQQEKQYHQQQQEKQYQQQQQEKQYQQQQQEKQKKLQLQQQQIDQHHQQIRHQQLLQQQQQLEEMEQEEKYQRQIQRQTQHQHQNQQLNHKGHQSKHHESQHHESQHHELEDRESQYR